MSTPTQQGPQGPQQRAGGGRPGAMTMAMQAVSTRPAGPKVLRIGVIQGDKMVEERIIRRRETVTVGASEKNHFIVAGLAGSFELFQLVGADYILNFTDAMRGRVGLAGGVEKLENLRASGAARNAGPYWQVKLSDTSRGRVTIGDTTLLFQFIDAPPVQPRPQLPAAVVGGFAAGIDWLFTAFVMFSFMTHFGFVIFLENADWPMQPTLATIPDQVADLIFQEPPAPEPEPEPTDTADTTETETETETAEAEATPRHEESTASSSDGTPSERQAAADSDARMAASDAAQQVETLLLGAMGSGEGAFADVLRGGAVTGSAEEVMAQAEGVNVAQGSAGGVLRERGGGGQVGGSGAELGGLRRAGDGTATQARQEGGQLEERAPRARMRFSGGDVEDEGGSGDFDQSVVVRMITTRRSAIQACYERELRQNPTLQGRVAISMTIQESGSVSNVRAAENSTGSDAVASCVVRVVQGFRFNPGPEGGSVSYTFPFVFEPQN
ncbi:MAG: TonB family protein [Sandaracinaceae bacterium]|nr:TonB family protein [Sandaracinaceae bacterium]